MSSRTLSLLLRIAALVVAVASIALFLVDFSRASVSNSSTLANLFAVPIFGVAVALMLLGVAEVVQHHGGPGGGAELARSIGRVSMQVNELERRVADIGNAVDRLSRGRPESDFPPARSEPQEVIARLPPAALEPLMRLLTEIRDLSLLTDVERRDRMGMLEHERKLVLIRETIDHQQEQRWTEGERLLQTLERQTPGDPDIRRTRQHFDDARRSDELDAIRRGRETLDNLMVINSWDQAYQTAHRLTTDFPGNVEARNLLSRVTRERDIHRETSVARAVEEIRHDTERRLWRRALMHSQRLVERFPDHPKVHRIREQLETMRENAEIEERQESEVRIQELVRARRFEEAIQLAEEVLRRFPESPQAEAIELLLPRIREFAREDAEGGGPDESPSADTTQSPASTNS